MSKGPALCAGGHASLGLRPAFRHTRDRRTGRAWDLISAKKWIGNYLVTCHARVHAHIHAHAHTHMHTHAHTHTHTHTHTRSHTCTHTRTHTLTGGA